MENEIAEEHKAIRPATKSPLNPGFSARTKEHNAKTPFTRYANHKEQVQMRAARLHIGMLRSSQDDSAEGERIKKELDMLRTRDIEHTQVILRQQIGVLKAMLKRQESQLRALKTENTTLKLQSRHQPSYDDTELLLALQLSAAESGIESQMGVDLDTMTYEQLLELGDHIGTVSVGLTPIQMARLKEEVSEEQGSTCSICQLDIDEGHLFKRLPACSHLHHSECIEQWLRSKNVCPVCKATAIA